MEVPEGYIIRDIVESDLEQILEIVNWMILNTDSIWRHQPDTLETRQKWLETTKASGYPAIGLFEVKTNQLAGFASSGPFRYGDGYNKTTECSIGFRESFTGRGLGHILLQHLILCLRKSGYTMIIAGISSTNQGSVRFFMREGFIKTAFMPGVGTKHGKILDLELLQMDLRSSRDDSNTLPETHVVEK
ncbi:acyl-CoA N-acyltransferase [Serendipita vermifera]|nr:acyl-CoA N-acyltransferase [Serendipita vermifera]